jgi:hypothetical protein
MNDPMGVQVASLSFLHATAVRARGAYLRLAGWFPHDLSFECRPLQPGPQYQFPGVKAIRLVTRDVSVSAASGPVQQQAEKEIQFQDNDANFGPMMILRLGKSNAASDLKPTYLTFWTKPPHTPTLPKDRARVCHVPGADVDQGQRGVKPGSPEAAGWAFIDIPGAG